MEKLRDTLHVSFSTKVIVPIVATMVLLMAITVSMVNYRLTEHFQDEAVRRLAKASTDFQKARKDRTHYLVERFKNLRNVPLYMALIQTGDSLTMTREFKKIPEEQGVDIVLFTSESGGTLVRWVSSRRTALPP
jgi:hypothetical protein